MQILLKTNQDTHYTIFTIPPHLEELVCADGKVNASSVFADSSFNPDLLLDLLSSGVFKSRGYRGSDRDSDDVTLCWGHRGRSHRVEVLVYTHISL